MKQKTYMLNTILTVVLGVVLLAAVLVRAFAPKIIIPELHVLHMTAISLIALLVDHYLVPKADRCYICVPVFSAAAFGILPYVTGFAASADVLRMAVTGAVVFTAATWLFSSMQNRLSTGPQAKAAPVCCALGLYLAVQCLSGMF